MEKDKDNGRQEKVNERKKSIKNIVQVTFLVFGNENNLVIFIVASPPTFKVTVSKVRSKII